MSNSEKNCSKIFKNKDKQNCKLLIHFLHLVEQLIKRELKNRLNKLKKMRKKEVREEKGSLKTH